MKRAKHIKMTEREFRKRKRKEFRIARKAMDKLNLGSAYLPPSAFRQFNKAEEYFKKAYEDCKTWWRNA